MQLVATTGCHFGNQMATQDRIGKDRIGKDREDEDRLGEARGSPRLGAQAQESSSSSYISFAKLLSIIL